MKKARLNSVVLILAVCMALATGQPSYARVAAMNLAQIVETAETIMDGTCTEVEYQKTDNGTRVTVYTFRVHHVYKGNAGEIAFIKMFGGRSQSLVAQPSGIPVLRKGKRYVLFLYPPGDRGLTSPVGWMQGSFLVRTGPDRRMTVANALNNQNLLKGVRWKEVEEKLCPANRSSLARARGQNEGPLEMEVFVDLVRALLSLTPRKDPMMKPPDTSGEPSSRSR
ncbi:MAG: hypothetical protein JRI22_03375 [Deltaproteobacteria bacterium]|nr:hypothetical protein [Deltaproteobacteria bacterium]